MTQQRRLERDLAVLRMVAVALGTLQVTHYPLLFLPGGRAVALTMLCALAAGAAAILVVSRGPAPPWRTLAAGGLVMDGAVAMAFYWNYGFDHRSGVWAVLAVVSIEGAARFGVAGALATWSALAAGSVTREAWRRQYGFEPRWGGVGLRMGIVLLLGLFVGTMAVALRRQRAMADQAQKRLDALVEGLDAIVWECDPDTFRFRYVNRAAVEILGYPLADWFDDHEFFARHLHPADCEWVLRECARATAAGLDHELEYRMVSADGRTVWLHDSVRVETEEGRPVRLRGVMVDVTERADASAALAASEARFRGFFEVNAVGMAVLDLDGRYLQVNDRLCEITGFDQAELVGSSYRRPIHPDDLPEAVAALDRMQAGGGPFRFERRYVRADGSVVWVLVSVAAALDDGGEPRCLVSQVVDITDRKQAEETLRSNERRLAAAQRTAGIGSWEWDIATDVVTWSDELRRIYGADLGPDATVECFLDLVHADDRERVVHTLATAHQSGQPFEFEHRAVRPDGSLRFLYCRGESVLGDDGRPSGMLGTAQDVTEQRAAEAALREAEERFRLAFENAPNGMALVATDGRYLRVNRSLCQLVGYTERDLLLKRFEDVLHPDDVATVTEAGTRVLAGELGSFTAECRYIHADGRTVWVEVGASVVGDPQRSGYFVAQICDISERKRSEEEVAAARDQAMEASRLKSEFLAVMSHEIRTPMNAVIGMGRLLLGTELDCEQHDCADTLVRSAYALLAIIDDILDFSKVEAGKLELEAVPFDLHDAVHDAVGVSAEAAYRKGLELAVSIDPSIDRQLQGDAGRLRQIIINLVGNAVKFTDRGEVVVNAVRSEAGPGSMAVRFEVVDTGPGIAVERQGALFEPFRQADASTSRRYGGTGLGLAICRRLVELMGGDLGVDSAPGAGSRFWFTARFARSAEEPGGRGSIQALSGARALVVDDNPTQRAVVRAQLSSWGVRVEVAGDTVSALSRMKLVAGRHPYDLLVADAHLCPFDVWFNSGAPGPAARHVILLVAPGSATKAIPPALPEGVVFLTKPVRKSELFELLGRAHTPGLLDGAASAAVVAQNRGRVLVAEDNVANQKVARLVLERLGYEVDVVDGGMWAIEAAARTAYAAILMDCQMPGMDGYATTEEIRRREGADRRTPIVAMTAAALRGDRERCLAAGMDDYVTKPVDPEQLDRVLARWVSRPDGYPLAGTEERDEPAGQAVEWERVDMLRQMCASGLGPDRWPELIGLFLEDAGQRVRRLEEAVAAADAEQVRELAHGLKGSSANFGAPALRELSSRLESLAVEGPLGSAGELVGRLRVEYERARGALAPTVPGPLDWAEEPRTGAAKTGFHETERVA